MSACMKNTVNKLFIIPPKLPCKRRISIPLRNKSTKRDKILRSEFRASVYYEQRGIMSNMVEQERVDIAPEQHASLRRSCVIGLTVSNRGDDNLWVG